MAYFPEHSSLFSQIIKDLKGKKVAVVSHIRPDGDCIGSTVALTRVLRALGIEVIAINGDPIPEFLRGFVGDTPFFMPHEIDPKGYIAISVDCSDKSRLGEGVNKCFSGIRLNIDHHRSNAFFAQDNIVLGGAAATAEILAGIFLDNAYKIDPIAAQALYMGIATDTGQFCFSATKQEVFAICTELVDLGASPPEAALELYENEPIGRLLLLREFLGTLKLELEGQVCIGWITQEMYHLTETTKENIEGFVNYPRSIKGIKIAALIEENSAGLKVSLRSKKDPFRVDLLASQFGGGGHACAAGFSISQQKINEFYPEFIKTIKNHIDNLNL